MRVDVVVREKAIVLKLRAIRNQSLNGCGNAVLGFDLGFHMCNGVGGVDFESDLHARGGCHGDLHARSETWEHVEHGMVPQLALVQSIVVIQRFGAENEALRCRGNVRLLLDLGLQIQDFVPGVGVED